MKKPAKRTTGLDEIEQKVRSKAHQISIEIEGRIPKSISRKKSDSDAKKVKNDVILEITKNSEMITAKMNAIKTVYMERIIIEANNAVGKMETMKILKLKGNIFENQRYNNLENYRKVITAGLK